MKIEQAKALNLCGKACNFAEKGECAYHRFPSHNYLNVEPGECALTPETMDRMRREYDLSPPRKTRRKK